MGQVTATTIVAATIVDADIATGASIGAAKLKHQQVASTDFGLEATATPTTGTFVVYVARGVCTLRDFAAVLYDSGTSTSITYDLLINGVSALTAVVTIVHGTGDRVPVAGTLATTALVSGDVLTMTQTVGSSTGALGGFAACRIDATYV